MKRFFIFILLLCASRTQLFQQISGTQDPKAGAILKTASEKIKALRSVRADFQMDINDRKENSGTSGEGTIVIKKEKYKLVSAGNTVYYDGKTMWTYSEDVNEVVITEPVNGAGQDFFTNPASLLSYYDRDFKYIYVGETGMSGKSYHEIDLFPIDISQPYSRIKLFINKTTGIPEIMHSTGKDGVDYTITLSNIYTDQDVPDSFFVFNAAEHKRVDVIDMRGTK
jgi:outer membrane lipoprotein carrier protein